MSEVGGLGATVSTNNERNGCGNIVDASSERETNAEIGCVPLEIGSSRNIEVGMGSNGKKSEMCYHTQFKYSISFEIIQEFSLICFADFLDQAEQDQAEQAVFEPFIILDRCDLLESDPLQIVKMENNEVFNQDVATVQLDELNNFHVVEIDDDIEMFYEKETDFTPKLNIVQVKGNDIFSGNMPFYIEVSMLELSP